MYSTFSPEEIKTGNTYRVRTVTGVTEEITIPELKDEDRICLVVDVVAVSVKFDRETVVLGFRNPETVTDSFVPFCSRANPVISTPLPLITQVAPAKFVVQVGIGVLELSAGISPAKDRFIFDPTGIAAPRANVPFIEFISSFAKGEQVVVD